MKKINILKTIASTNPILFGEQPYRINIEEGDCITATVMRVTEPTHVAFKITNRCVTTEEMFQLLNSFLMLAFNIPVKYEYVEVDLHETMKRLPSYITIEDEDYFLCTSAGIGYYKLFHVNEGPVCKANKSQGGIIELLSQLSRYGINIVPIYK